MEKSKNKEIIIPVIKMLNDIIEKKANQSFKKFDITFTQLRVVLLLSYNQDKIYSLKELEEIFNVSQQTMAGIIKRLELKRLVENVKNPNDRRIKKVKITEKGKILAKKTEDKMFENENMLCNCLDEEEREIFCKLLKKIYNSLK